MERLKKLYDVLLREKYYTNSFEEFQKKFEDPKYVQKVYEVVKRDKLYTKSFEDFNMTYNLKKKDSSEPTGDQVPMESPSQPSQDPFSSDSSNEPTAPIDPTTGLPFKDDNTQVVEEDISIDNVGDEDLETLPSNSDERDQTKELYNRGEFFIEGSQEKDTYLEQLVGKNSVTDLIGDIYRSGKQGLIQGNTADEAGALMLSGSDATDEQIEAFLQSQESLQNQGTTDEMMNFNRIYDQADNKFTGFLEGIVKNPSVVFQIGAQTITQLLNPASIGAGAATIATGAAYGAGTGAMAGGVGALPGAVAGAIGSLRTAFAVASGTLESTLSFGEFIKEEIDKRDDLEFNEDGIKAILNNEETFNRVWKKSVGRGAAIGIIDRLSLGMGGRLIKAGKLTGKAAIGTNLAAEMIGGGVGESAARALVGQEQDVREIGFETFGGIGKAPISYAINKVTDPVTTPIKKAMLNKAESFLFPPTYKLIDAQGESVPQTKEDVVDTIDNTDDVTFMGLNYTISNDPDLKKRYDARKMLIITGENIRQKLEAAGVKNNKNIDKIISLEIEKNNFIGATTEAGKKRLKEIKEEISKLSGITDEEVNTKDSPGPLVAGLKGDGRRSGSETVVLNDDGTIVINPYDKYYLGGKYPEGPGTFKEKQNTERKSLKSLLGERSGKSDRVYIVEDQESGGIDPSYSKRYLDSANVRTKDKDGKLNNQEANEKELLTRAENAALAMAKLLPGTNIVLHKTEKSYERSRGNPSKKSNARGHFKPSSNDIHINMPFATKETIAHEVFHALLFNQFAKAANVTKNMANTLMNQINDPEIKEQIEDFMDLYTVESNPNIETKAQEKRVQQEEKLTKFMGLIAENFDTFNAPEKKEVKTWVQKVIDIFVPSTPKIKEITRDFVATEENLKELLTALSEDITKGREVDSVDFSAFDVADMGRPVEGADGPIPSGIDEQGPPIEVLDEQMDRGGIDLKTIRRGDINELEGANAFVFAADQATYGMTESPSGLKFMFNGGFLYPYGAQSQGSNAVWVFSNEAAANKVLNKAKESDGVGLVMAQASSGVSGNLQFYDFLNAEIAYAIEKGASPKEMVDYINLKLADKTKDGRDGKITRYLKSKGLPTQIKDYQELQDLFKPTNFEVRGNFARKFMSAESFKKFGIYPFDPKKTVDGDIESVVNDPALKNINYGDVVSAIQFDKDGQVVRLNENDPGYHPAYPFSLPGAPIMVFNNGIDVRKIYPQAKPENPKMNQTPLGERGKKEAGRSVMGGQYISNIPKDVQSEDASIDISEEVVDKSERKPKFKKETESQTTDENQTYLFQSQDPQLVKEVQLNILKGLNQGFKKGLGTIREYLKTLKNDGRLGNKQIGEILGLVVEEDAFANKAARNETVEKIKKIITDADRQAEFSTLRTKAKRAAKNLKRSIGRIISDAISGKDITLESLLRDVVTIDPSVVPEEVYQDYKDIIDGLGDRLVMLDNAEDAGLVAVKSRRVLEAMNNVYSRIPQLIALFLDNVLISPKGTVAYKKTIDFLLENDLITESDVSIMKVYRDTINPRVKTVKTDKQKAAERKKLIEGVDKIKIKEERIDSGLTSFPFRKTREDIREFIKLIKDQKALQGLPNEDLNNIIRLANTINNGYAPGIMSRLISKIKAQRDAAPIISDIKSKKLKLPTVEGIYSKLKTFNPFNKQSKFYNALERGQLYNIDRLFGNFDTKKMFNAFFNDMAVNQQQMEVNNTKESKLRDNARKLLEKAYTKLGVVSQNKVAEADARLMFYRIQLEYDTNRLTDKKVKPAIEWLDATIQYLEANQLYDPQSKREVEVLKKIRKDYDKKDVSVSSIYNKFNKQEKEALKILQQIDIDNTGKAVYAAQQRDAAFIARQNYTHISVRPKSRERVDINKDVINDFINSTDANRRPSTKSKSGIERTGLVSPIYTSAINASERGSKFTNLDYYMTTPVRKAKQTFKALKDKLIEDYKGSPPAEVQMFLDSLDKGISQSVQNVLGSNFVENSFMQMVSSSLQKLGYRTMLVSAPRAAVEYLSNMMFAAVHPKTFASGVSKKNNLSREELINVLTNLGSKVITRVTGNNLMSSKVDLELLNKKSYKGERFVSAAKEKVMGVWDATGKKIQNFTALIADTLISSPDKMVMKPFLLGKLSDTFKEITGKDIDYNKIAANDEAYITENKEALDAAIKEADEFVTLIGATDNPFMSRLQGKDAKGVEEVWVNFNNFMTTFLKQEYDTSVVGLAGVMQNTFTYGDSSISRAEGAKLLAAVTMRMTAYSLGIKVAGELLLEAFGVESEDEEKDIELQVGQALATTFTSLIVGRNFGNAFKTIQNYNIELLNAEFGDALRDGEYDQYRDAIQYNIIPLVRTGQDYKSGRGMDAGKIVPNFLGPYSPPVKSAAFALKKLTEPNRKTSVARQRQVREKQERIPLELLGNTGFIPLYRDVRKVLLADIYKDLRKEKVKTYNREELEQLKLDNPRKYRDVIYDKKMLRYEKALEKYKTYLRDKRGWREANPGKRKPTMPKRPRK